MITEQITREQFINLDDDGQRTHLRNLREATAAAAQYANMKGFKFTSSENKSFDELNRLLDEAISYLEQNGYPFPYELNTEAMVRVYRSGKLYY